MNKLRCIMAVVLASACVGLFAQSYAVENVYKSPMYHCVVDEILYFQDAPLIGLMVSVGESGKKPAIMQLSLSAVEGHESDRVVRSFQRLAGLCKSANKVKVPVSLVLANGEVFTSNDFNMDYDERFVLHLINTLSSFNSDRKDFNPSYILGIHQYCCQQLRSFNIVKIIVAGDEFVTENFRSAATFDRIFDDFEDALGDGILFKPEY